MPVFPPTCAKLSSAAGPGPTPAAQPHAYTRLASTAHLPVCPCSRQVPMPPHATPCHPIPLHATDPCRRTATRSTVQGQPTNITQPLHTVHVHHQSRFNAWWRPAGRRPPRTCCPAPLNAPCHVNPPVSAGSDALSSCLPPCRLAEHLAEGACASRTCTRPPRSSNTQSSTKRCGARGGTRQQLRRVFLCAPGALEQAERQPL